MSWSSAIPEQETGRAEKVAKEFCKETEQSCVQQTAKHKRGKGIGQIYEQTNRLIHTEKAILPKRNRHLKPKASPASAPALLSDPGPDNQQGSEGLRRRKLASA